METMNKEQTARELNQYFYTQSSKFSTVARYYAYCTLVLNVLLIMHCKDNLHVLWLLGVLPQVVYLILDMDHYYNDATNYYKELKRLDNDNYDEESHENSMDDISLQSYNSFLGKRIMSVIMVITSSITSLLALAWAVN